jgi:hypothetical protein
MADRDIVTEMKMPTPREQSEAESTAERMEKLRPQRLRDRDARWKANAEAWKQRQQWKKDKAMHKQAEESADPNPRSQALQNIRSLFEKKKRPEEDTEFVEAMEPVQIVGNN